MNPLDWFDWLKALEPIWGYLILGAGAFFEYLCPPFPGDTVVLLGAVMIGAADWGVAPIMLATCVGSVLGALLDYEVGRWMASSKKQTWLHKLLASEKFKPRVDEICERFNRYGAAFILVNRFLPAIRGIFFVVAGMSGLKRSSTLFYAALSAVAWNLLIIGVGYLVGFNLDALKEIFEKYTTGAWILIGVVTLTVIGRKIHGHLKARREAQREEISEKEEP